MNEEINKFLVDPSAQSPFVRWGSYESDETHVLTLKLCVPVEEIPSHLSPLIALIRRKNKNDTDEKIKADGGSHPAGDDVHCPLSSSSISLFHAKSVPTIPIKAIVRFDSTCMAKDSASSANSNSAATTRGNTKASAAHHSPLTAIRSKASAAGSGSGGAGEQKRSTTDGSPKNMMITASLMVHSPSPLIGKASDFLASPVPIPCTSCTCTSCEPPLISGSSQSSQVKCQICASSSDVDLMYADFPSELSISEKNDNKKDGEGKNKAVSYDAASSTCGSAVFTTDATHFMDIIRWAEAHCMAEAQHALACRVALLEKAYADYYYMHFKQQQEANTCNLSEEPSGEGETEKKATVRKTPPATYPSESEKDEEREKVQLQTSSVGHKSSDEDAEKEESSMMRSRVEEEGGGMGWRAGTCEMGDPIFSSGAYTRMHTSYSSQSHTEEYHHHHHPIAPPRATRDDTPFFHMHRELAAIVRAIRSNSQLTDVSAFGPEQINSHFSTAPYSPSTSFTGTSASRTPPTVAYKIQDDVLRKTLAITVLYDYSRKLTPLTCEAWNLEQPIKSQIPTTGELSEATEPLQIIFKFNRERFLSQLVEVVVGQKQHFSTGVFLGAAGHIRNVMDNLMKYASRRPQQPVVSSSSSSPPSRTFSLKEPSAISGKDDAEDHADEVALFRQRYYNEFDGNHTNTQTNTYTPQGQGRWQGAVAEVYRVIRAEENKSGAIGDSSGEDSSDNDEDGADNDGNQGQEAQRDVSIPQQSNSTPNTCRTRSSRKAVLKQRLCDAEESFDFVTAIVTYLDLRIDNLTHFCAICDKKHATANNKNTSTAASLKGNKKGRLSHLVRSAVCTRSLCSFRFQSLGVGRNAAAALSLHPVVADALIAFTRCAIRTIRWDSILQPFPMLFGKNGELVIGEGLEEEEEKTVQAAGSENQSTSTNSKIVLRNDLKSGPHRAKREEDIAKLRALVEHLPSTASILQGNWDNNADGHRHQKSEEALILTRNLINWIFSSCTSYIKLLEGQPIKFMEAAHQFVFIQSTQRHARAFEERKARTLVQGKRTLWAFHGSRHENWHSIVRNGLVNASGTALQVNGAAYGSGIYLSPHASVSYTYSGMSNYDKPLKGPMKPTELINRDGYHCIAICEVIDEDLNKTQNNTIWIQPHSSHVMTRFFFVFNRGNICGGKSLVLTDPAIAEQLDRALML